MILRWQADRFLVISRGKEQHETVDHVPSLGQVLHQSDRDGLVCDEGGVETVTTRSSRRRIETDRIAAREVHDGDQIVTEPGRRPRVNTIASVTWPLPGRVVIVFGVKADQRFDVPERQLITIGKRKTKNGAAGATD